MATWPKNNKASTQYVDEDTDLIGNSRADLKKNIDNVNDIIDTFDLGGDSSGQIADGDILQYQQDSGGGGRFVPLSADQLGGSNTLLVPFTGWVVNNWSGITSGFRAGDSSGNKHNFDRMALLGGAYYKRDPAAAGDLDLVASEGTVFNSISGASVTTATPTLNKPTGYSITGTNVNITITSGIATNSGGTNAQLNAGGTNDSIVSGSSKNVMFGEGYESYITLPAGNYFLKMISRYDAEYSDAVHHARAEVLSSGTQLEGNAEPFIMNSSVRSVDMWIYNKTDDTFITDPNFLFGEQGYVTNTFTDLDQVTTGSQGQRFTLTGTKQIMIWTGVNTQPGSNVNNGNTRGGDTNKDFLGFLLSQATTLSGDVVDVGGNTKAQFFKGGTVLPARYGWVTRLPQSWIEIVKF